jgi:DEAD/DEAH box helicase domain-containing protein
MPATPVPAPVWERLGIDALWAHQARAVDLIRAGTPVVVATGTASGKSLCYQLPIAEAVAPGGPRATALLLFPTKALAQDQLRALGAMELPGLVPAALDGDSPPEHRRWVRTHANVVLTNPEMLHASILPHHPRWATFLMRLRYVVVDELHALRGIFGTHVAHLLRRLRRIAAHYGSDPTFVCSSATIGEPGRLASELCGTPVTEIVDDASPRGERWLAFWNPRGSADGSREAAARREAARLTAALVGAGHRTITFCRSRVGVETVAAEVRRRLPPALAGTVRAYRAGYLREERREIEAALFSGTLRAVVATTALELGVDVGGLDACVLDGFPGTIASFRQQVGRAGRTGRPSLAVLVAGDDQLDQWLVRHPEEVLTRPPEPVVVNLTNRFVAIPHLACAAYELPLRHDDERWWPRLLDDAVRRLVLDDRLRIRPAPPGEPPSAVWSGGPPPAPGVGLRGVSGDEYRIVRSDGNLIGTVDAARAMRVVHPGAVYLHQGHAWRVEALDLDERTATVEPADGSEFTQPLVETDATLLDEERCRPVGCSRLGLGTVRIWSRVVGYRRHDVRSGELLGVHELHLPPTELETRGIWYTVAPELADAAGVAPAALPGSLHAAEHAAIGMLPLFTVCDRWDVGGVSTTRQAQTGRPTIVIHDAYPGGAGVAELAYEVADHHLATTLEVVRSCGCASGCPSCIHSPKCGSGNEPLDKQGAIALLAAITGT